MNLSCFDRETFAPDLDRFDILKTGTMFARAC